MPSEWIEIKLKDIAEKKITNGAFNDPKRVGKGYRLVNVVDLYNPQRIDVKNLKRLDL